jgi:hypothetical protein
MMRVSLATTGDSTMGFCQSTCKARILRGRCYVVVGVLLGILATGGCAHKPTPRKDRAGISGTVTYKEKPVTGGMVTFTSAKDATETTSCVIGADGRYAIGDAPIGETRVTIDTESLKPELGSRYVQLPAKYLAAETSELTCTVKPGDNTADFNLQ